MLLFYLVIAAVLVNLSIGFFTLWKKMDSLTNRVFFLLTVIASAWSAVNYLSVSQTTSAATLYYARWELFFASIYSTVAFLTIYIFPSPQWKAGRRTLYLLMGGMSTIAGLCLTPFVIQAIEGSGTQVQVTPGPAIALFGAYNAFLIFMSLRLTWNNLKKSRGNRRMHYLFLFFGIIVSNFAAFITNFVLVNILHITALLPSGPFFALVFAILMGYAIMTQEIFNVRLFFSRAALYALLLGAVLSAYSIVIFLFTTLLPSYQYSSQSFAVSLAGAVIVGFSFEPIRRLLQTRTDTFLYRKEYKQQEVIQSLIKQLTQVVTLQEAVKAILSCLTDTLHLRQAVAYTFQHNEQQEVAVLEMLPVGYANPSRQLVLRPHDPFLQYFLSRRNITLLSQLNKEVVQEKTLLAKAEEVDPILLSEHPFRQAVVTKCLALHSQVVIPLYSNNQLVSLLLLGSKLSGDTFSPTDLALIETARDQTVTAIQKAKLYEGDQMKNEFVSVASHELLTPISAMEGYLSMILREDSNSTMDPQAREYVNKVFAATHRLGILVKDLLSVSRVEAGTLNFDLQPLDLTEIIGEVIDQLSLTAQSKGLALHYSPPTVPLPNIQADRERTLQVLINLISNSIKYTPQGSVTVEVHHHPSVGQVSVTVSDTGLGIPKHDQPHLFQKFYRVDTPDRVGITGTGLGLYLIKMIVEKMHGRITFKSTTGKGSTFEVFLPLAKPVKS
jgi:signal transduction histidine kinase